MNSMNVYYPPPFKTLLLCFSTKILNLLKIKKHLTLGLYQIQPLCIAILIKCDKVLIFTQRWYLKWPTHIWVYYMQHLFCSHMHVWLECCSRLFTKQTTFTHLVKNGDYRQSSHHFIHCLHFQSDTTLCDMSYFWRE